MSLMTSRVVRTDELAKRLGVTRSTIWRWIREGRLPPKHQYGPNCSGWLETELEGWWEALGSPVANDNSAEAES
jgi:predicted DNA-binding transcriptional regulator AlpA